MNPRTKERQGWQLKGNVRLKEKQQNLQKRQQQGWQWRGNVQLKQEQRNLVVVDFSILYVEGFHLRWCSCVMNHQGFKFSPVLVSSLEIELKLNHVRKLGDVMHLDTNMVKRAVKSTVSIFRRQNCNLLRLKMEADDDVDQ